MAKRKPNYKRIAALERELGLIDRPPTLHEAIERLEQLDAQANGRMLDHNEQAEWDYNLQWARKHQARPEPVMVRYIST